MKRIRKGDKIRVGKSEGVVLYVGATSVFADFDGFTTLLNFNRFEKVKSEDKRF